MTTEEIEKNRSLFPMDDLTFSKWLALLHQADLVMYANDIVSKERITKDRIKLNEIID
jgi:precorrin-4 methylase